MFFRKTMAAMRDLCDQLRDERYKALEVIDRLNGSQSLVCAALDAADERVREAEERARLLEEQYNRLLKKMFENDPPITERELKEITGVTSEHL